nr:MAG TPA: hypothetical protein [Caudoviricetes sp.]
MNAAKIFPITLIALDVGAAVVTPAAPTGNT